MSLEHAKARQPEIIRCVQKDARYTTQIRELLLELFESFCPRSRLKFYHQWSAIISPLAYYGFHSIFRLQTLGEEYTGTIQMDSSFLGMPNRAIQLFTYVLEFCGENLLHRLLQSLRRKTKESTDLRVEISEKLVTLLEGFAKSIPFLKVIHLGFFYLAGNKYQISRRITGLNYVVYNYMGRPKGFLRNYRWLGVVTFLQLAVVGYKQYKSILAVNAKDSRAVATTSKRLGEVDTPRLSEERCALCLEHRLHTSVTTCGHAFCWTCILDCLQNRCECPVCRETIKSQNVVFLRNYV